MKIFLEGYKTTTQEEGDGEPWGSRGDSHTEWSFENLTTRDNHVMSRYQQLDSIEVGDVDWVGKPVFAVVAVWHTADSFGWDENYYAEMMAVYDNADKAHDAVKKLEAAERNDEGAVELPDGFKLSYVPWEGYFERLSYIEIVKGILD